MEITEKVVSKSSMNRIIFDSYHGSMVRHIEKREKKDMMEKAGETSEEKDNSNDNVERENSNDNVEENSGKNLYDDKEQRDSDYDEDIEDSRDNDEILETIFFITNSLFYMSYVS